MTQQEFKANIKKNYRHASSCLLFLCVWQELEKCLQHFFYKWMGFNSVCFEWVQSKDRIRNQSFDQLMETKLEAGMAHASVIFVCLKRTRKNGCSIFFTQSKSFKTCFELFLSKADWATVLEFKTFISLWEK